MNRKQKVCLLVGIAVIVAMGLYPPWVIERFKGSYKFGYATEPGPYSWIGNPPPAEYLPDHPTIKKTLPRFIDLYRLGLQYFVVAVVTAGLMIILKDQKGSLTDGRKKESNNL